MFRILIIFGFLGVSSATFAAPTDNCQVQYRQITASGLIHWSAIRAIRTSEGLEFISPKDGKQYRFSIFINGGLVDAILQDSSIVSYSTIDPSIQLTTANGYVAHATFGLNEGSKLPLLIVASELNELEVECWNVIVSGAH